MTPSSWPPADGRPAYGAARGARRATGAVVCWGEGEAGQLGDGMAVSRSAPVTVMLPP